MSDWQEYLLEDVIEKFIDYRGKTPTKTSSGVPLITAKVVKAGKILTPNEFIAPEDYDDWMTRGLPEINDVVLTTEAPLGEVALIKDKNVALAQRIITLRGKKELLHNPFLKYYFQNEAGQHDLQSRASGTTVFGIKASVLKKVPIEIPALEEQKAIASVLSSLDDKIDLLHRQNTTLERMAETLFRQWFVEEAQSFASGKIGALIEGTFGGDWGKETPEGDFNNAVNCIRGTDIADLQTGLAKKIPLRFVSTKKLQSIEPKNGDIIFEISGGTETQSTGRATYINDDVRSLFAYPLVFSNFCRLLRPLNTTYSYFIYLYLSYLYEQDEFFGLENGSSGIKNLNYKALFFELDYPMPSSDRVQKFNDLVTPSFSKINQNKKQIKTLEKLRDNLLPKLMSGEVRVS